MKRLTLLVLLALPFVGRADLTNTNFVVEASAVMVGADGVTFNPPPTQLVVRAKEILFPDNTTQRTAAVAFPSALTNGSFSINGVTATNGANYDTSQVGNDQLIFGPGTTMMTMYDLNMSLYDETLEYTRIAIQDLLWTNGTAGSGPAGVSDSLYYVSTNDGNFVQLWLSSAGWRDLSGALVSNIYVRPYDRLYYNHIGSSVVTNPLTGWNGALAKTAPPPAAIMQGVFYALHLARSFTGDVSQAQLGSYPTLSVLATSLTSSARTLSTLAPPLSNNAPGTHMETRFGATNLFIFNGPTGLWFRTQGTFQW